MHVLGREWVLSVILKTENEHTLQPCCFRLYVFHPLPPLLPPVDSATVDVSLQQFDTVLRGSVQTAQLLLWLNSFFLSFSSDICSNSFSLPPRNPPVPQAELSLVQKQAEPDGAVKSAADLSAAGQNNTACSQALEERWETLRQAAVTVKEWQLWGSFFHCTQLPPTDLGRNLKEN